MMTHRCGRSGTTTWHVCLALMLSGSLWQAWETILEVISEGESVAVRIFGATPAEIRERIPKSHGVRIQRDRIASRYQAFHPQAIAVGEAYASFSRSWLTTGEDSALEECIAWLWQVESKLDDVPDLS